MLKSTSLVMLTSPQRLSCGQPSAHPPTNCLSCSTVKACASRGRQHKAYSSNIAHRKKLVYMHLKMCKIKIKFYSEIVEVRIVGQNLLSVRRPSLTKFHIHDYQSNPNKINRIFLYLIFIVFFSLESIYV